ncbi:MAG: fluoride efflux transporter CrcB [Thermoanaerobaculia bacterium]|nr:MAG: fluoride efflux transporter CrcB [Thermoanaerobaculia bacterium]
MAKVLLVGLGSFLGGIARYVLSGFVHRHLGTAFPYGTMVVNVVGCLVIGGVLHLVEDRSVLGPDVRLFIAVGLIGGFTTFSAFGYETVALLRDSDLRFALLNIAGNLLLGLGAVWLGRTILRAVGV